MNKNVLITGATSGIGMATAIKFAINSYNLIICGRRSERLNELKKFLESKYSIKVLTLAFDIRNKKEVEASINSIPDEFKDIDILVNNAGLALGFRTIQNGDTDDWDQMIDTNIKGLLYVTRMVTPNMVNRGKGHIINIGSVAGREVYPSGNVYCATKHAVDALNKAMRVDMLKHNIKVTAVNPGAAETEFSLVRYKGDSDAAKKVYDGFTPLYGENIAEIIYFIVNLPDNVNVNDILVMPTAQANTSCLHKG